MIKINLIVARSLNGVIGKDGTIPWHIPDDFKMFRDATLGHAVVMGRKTYESLPGVLKGRLNIVVSSTMSPLDVPEGVTVVRSFRHATELAQTFNYKLLWVIGGEGLYEAARNDASEMYITEVKVAIPYQIGDTVAKFTVDLDRTRWVQTKHERREHEGLDYTWDIWARRCQPKLYEGKELLNEPVKI